MPRLLPSGETSSPMNPLTRNILVYPWLARARSIGLLILIFLLSSTSRPAHAQGAGNALDLEAAANEHLLIPHSPSLDISASTLTVEAWILPESYPETFPTAMAKFNSASSWEFDVKNDNTVEWELFTAEDAGGAEPPCATRHRLQAGRYRRVLRRGAPPLPRA